MKKLLCIICVAVLCFNGGLLASAEVNIPDVFGEDYVEFDVNVDGCFNICDLVRAKKYVGGMPVTVNLRFIENDLGDAQILAILRQELLKGDNR